MKKHKKQRSVTIIGGADGPTSVFLAGSKSKVPLKMKIKGCVSRYKRKRAMRQIIPGTHTLKEVESYIRKKYGAIAISKRNRTYIIQRNNLKEHLVVTKKPELLGELKEIQRPKEYNEATIQVMMEQMKARSEMIAQIPDEEVPTDFRMYKIHRKEGKLEIEMDFKWEILSCSCSGSKKEMRALMKIQQEIYRYYGVSKKDIENHSIRYKSLVAALSDL